MNAPMKQLPAVDRRTFLGGSDIAAVMGLSPWCTPLQLYERKIGAAPEEITDEKRRFFARRKRQEPVVADMLNDEYGIEVERLSLDDNPNRYIDSEFGFLAAEIDFEFRMTPALRDHFPERPDFAAIADGELLNGEIKTVHPFMAREWGEQGSEQIPIHYEVQVLHGLGVTRRPGTLVAALFGLDSLQAFPVTPDDETVRGIRQQAVRFWSNHVLARIPPAPSNMDDMMRLFAKSNGRPVVADDAMLEALGRLRAIRSNIATLEREQEEVEFEIADAVRLAWAVTSDTEPLAMDNAVITFDGAPCATWKKQSREGIDVKRLKSEQPEIAAQYTRTSWFRAFRFPKQKGA